MAQNWPNNAKNSIFLKQGFKLFDYAKNENLSLFKHGGFAVVKLSFLSKSKVPIYFPLDLRTIKICCTIIFSITRK